MPQILAGIDHIVVVMLENRSLDNMLGTLYSDGTRPAQVLPAGGAAEFDGVRAGFSNPSNAGYFSGDPPQSVPVATAVQSSTVPDPDPEETFTNVTYQIFGPQGAVAAPRWPMQGFVINYAQTGAGNATQIMQCHDPAQVPVLATLARSYAVSDAWFASVPSQTWPNRAFAHTGTSNGHVDNGSPPDPLLWNVPTIFNVLDAVGASWAVYRDNLLVPSLVRTMFPQLWPVSFDAHFHVFDQFVDDCAHGALPQYAFVEPSFIIDPNDEHPPHDVNAGEAFLHAVWSAVSSSPAFAKTLLLITYDEHGGCYDHVLPPFGATPPDAASMPGDQGFGFDRFGVRVPAVAVSPWIAAGTVFRSDRTVPYDHASIPATLRDWLGIPASVMLPSRRVAAAPTLAQLVTLSAPRSDIPLLPEPAAARISTPTVAPPNDLQKSLVSGSARRLGLDPRAELAQIQTRQHAAEFFQRHPARTR
jgi:phospholipase C